MQPISVRSLFPHADITIHTTRGPVYAIADLEADLVSLDLQRSTSGSAGAFSLELTARAYKDGTWADRIQPMDYVEIRAGNLHPSSYPNGKLPMRFRGFVDLGPQSFAIPPQGGPQRSVTISGRDYTKLPMVSQIQYLWTTSLSQALANAASGWGLTANWGFSTSSTTMRAFISQVLQHIFEGTSGQSALGANPFLPLFRKTGVDAPNLLQAVSVPDTYTINLLTVEPYTGSLWNLITYFSSPPLGECFIYDAEAGPVLVVRIAPFKDLAGKFVSPGLDPGTQKHQLGPITLSTDLIPQQEIGYSDNEVLNYFFVYSDVAQMGAGSQFSYLSPNQNPWWNAESTAKYGFRPLNLDTPLVAAITQNPNFQQNAASLAQYLGATQGHNEQLRSGTITCHGDESLIPGRYVTVPYSERVGLSFYLEEVTETFAFKGAQNPTWTAQLGVTRGQDVPL